MLADTGRRHGAQGAPAPTVDKAPSGVIAYHAITPEDSAYGYDVSMARLDDHLLLLAGWRGRFGDGLDVEITYDDGHASNHRHALPVLQKHGAKAVFFVTAGHIDNHREFMTWSQLAELVACGHQVQAHGWSHARLTDCTATQLTEELVRARQTIEDRLGCGVDALSLPHGRSNRRVLAQAARAGYRRIYTSDPWSGRHSRHGVEMVGRLMVRSTMTAPDLAYLLTVGGTPLALLKAKHRLKEGIRRMMGERLYFRLWSRLRGWQQLS